MSIKNKYKPETMFISVALRFQYTFLRNENGRHRSWRHSLQGQRNPTFLVNKKVNGYLDSRRALGFAYTHNPLRKLKTLHI